MKEGFGPQKREKEKINRIPNKFGNHKAALAAAIMSALSGSGTPAEAQSAQVRPEKTAAIATVPKSPPMERPDSVKDLEWFTKQLKEKMIVPKELRRLEDFVIHERIPLSEQVAFMTKMLQRDGNYDREMRSLKLSDKVMSQINNLQSIVSARLTRAYEEDRYNPALKRYFSIDNLIASTRILSMESLALQEDGKTTTFSCNGFLTVFNGDVYLATADHCVAGKEEEKQFKRSHGTDQAVKYIPPAEYKAWNISEPSSLPSISSESTKKNSSGKVVVSYSWGPTADLSRYVQKVHFAVSMVQPEIYRKSNSQSKETAPFAGSMMFLMPPAAGKILERKPRNADGTLGEVVRIGASGSSGSLVAGYDGTKFTLLGPFQAAGVVNDDCRRLCHAATFFGNPEDLYGLIRSEQRDRALKMLDEASVPDLPVPNLIKNSGKTASKQR